MSRNPNRTRILIRKALEGDGAAQNQLDARYRRRLLTLAHKRVHKLPAELRPELNSEDIVQSVFLKAWQGLGHFEYRGEGTFYRQLCTILRHLIHDRLERLCAGKRPQPGHREAISRIDQTLVDAAGEFATPSRTAMLHEDIAGLMRALNRLPPDQREVLLLRYESYSWSDVARIVNKSPDAVRMLGVRAFKKLKEIYGCAEECRKSNGQEEQL